jgi:hypothetical protein
MFKKFKNTLQIFIGIVLVTQLTGCYYGSDHHYHGWWHHDRVIVVHEH